MKCGNCKNSHATVAEVRACYANKDVQLVLDLSEPKPLSPIERIRAAAATLPEGVEHVRVALPREGTNPEDDIWDFYVIDRPTDAHWKGYTFVRRQESDGSRKATFSDTVRVLEAVALDPQKAIQNYGMKIGSCGYCGHTLTDPVSIAFGVGPWCRKAYGVTTKPEPVLALTF